MTATSHDTPIQPTAPAPTSGPSGEHGGNLAAPAQPQRDRAGRFLPGNDVARGRGNPRASEVHRLREIVLTETNPDRFRKVWLVVLSRALRGEPWAIREVLDRTLGKPMTTAEIALTVDRQQRDYLEAQQAEQRAALRQLAETPDGRKLLQELASMADGVEVDAVGGGVDE